MTTLLAWAWVFGSSLIVIVLYRDLRNHLEVFGRDPVLEELATIVLVAAGVSGFMVLALGFMLGLGG